MQVNYFKKVALSVFAFVSVLPLYCCSGGFNETIPTKEKLESIIKIPIDNEVGIEADFNFEYPGRYVVYLVLRQKNFTTNEPEKFKLQGVVEVVNEAGDFLHQSKFDVLAASNNTGLTLDKFEVNKKDISGVKQFKIKFGEGLKVANSYFSSIELHVKKELKHSIFD